MKQILYIAGTSFSGSTLLSFLVNAHPEMTSVGEVTGPIQKLDRDQYPCSCGEAIGQCPFWRSIGEAMAKRGFEFDADHWEMAHIVGQGPKLQQLLSGSLGGNSLEQMRDAVAWNATPWAGEMRQRARRVGALVESVMEKMGVRVLADASKSPHRIPFLRRLGDYSVKVVFLVRDPRGFVYSNIKNHDNQPTVADSAKVWNRISERMERQRQLLADDSSIVIRYEDLCTNLTQEMNRITTMLGLDPIEMPILFKDAEHHIIGNRMRLSGGDAVKLNELWRESLTKEQIEEVERLTVSNRSRYGYA